MALLRRQPGRGVLFSFRSRQSVRRRSLSAPPARSRDAVQHEPQRDCWDSAVIESFNATIKTELIHRYR
jgi:hypothetical protein